MLTKFNALVEKQKAIALAKNPKATRDELHASENQDEAAIGMLYDMPIYPHVAKALTDKHMLLEVKKLTGIDLSITEAEKEWRY